MPEGDTALEQAVSDDTVLVFMLDERGELGTYGALPHSQAALNSTNDLCRVVREVRELWSRCSFGTYASQTDEGWAKDRAPASRRYEFQIAEPERVLRFLDGIPAAAYSAALDARDGSVVRIPLIDQDGDCRYELVISAKHAVITVLRPKEDAQRIASD